MVEALAIERKREEGLYFKTLGEVCFSKCACKGIEPECTIEYMILNLMTLHASHTLLNN